MSGDNRPTLCMYTPPPDGGMALYTCELMKALARRPHDFRFELVCEEGLAEPFRSELYRANDILPRLRHRSTMPNRAAWIVNRLAYYPRRERRFLKWLQGRPDVVGVHLQEWTYWLAAPLVRRIQRMGKKVFYTVHNVLPHHYPPIIPRALVHHWIRKACLRCDGLFVHTAPLADELARFLGERHPPIQIVPHGVWTMRSAEAANSANPTALAERMAWKKLLFFGSIRRNKGLHLLLEAARQLEGYSITIAGEPQEKQYFEIECRPLIDALRRAGRRIELLDRFIAEEEMPGLFAAHSAVVLPYTPQFVAQSGVLFMALAHDLPVIASEAGGMRDLLREYPVGSVFRGSSPDALIHAIRDLFENASHEALASSIRDAKRRLSWQETARLTIETYRSVLCTVQESDDPALETTTAG